MVHFANNSVIADKKRTVRTTTTQKIPLCATNRGIWIAPVLSVHSDCCVNIEIIYRKERLTEL